MSFAIKKSLRLSLNWQQILNSTRRKDFNQNVRHVSALYITGDKATENYASLQPYLDFAQIFANLNIVQENISVRKLSIDLEVVLDKYKKYAAIYKEVKELEEQRFENSKAISSTKSNNDVPKELILHGRQLRQKHKLLKQQLYPIEEDFVLDFLQLPNRLHEHCPRRGYEELIFSGSSATKESDAIKCHLDNTKLICFIDRHRYYLLGEAAKFDLNSTLGLTRYCVDAGGFEQMSNPDFARRVLLEASSTELTKYYIVKEDNLQNKINVAYLTGGGSFESFLGALTRLNVWPTALPIKWVSYGRHYLKTESSLSGSGSGLYSAVQSNAVQTLVAVDSAAAADDEFESILHLAVNFYKSLGLQFRIAYEDASKLTPAECLRATIEAYSPVEKRYICIGQVSNYGDFISKRILCGYRQDNDYNFLHLVGGPILYTTKLIAALLEQNISLTDCKILRSAAHTPAKAIDVFKSLFT